VMVLCLVLRGHVSTMRFIAIHRVVEISSDVFREPFRIAA